MRDVCQVCGAPGQAGVRCASCGAPLAEAQAAPAAVAIPPAGGAASMVPPAVAGPLVAFYCRCGQALAGPPGAAVVCPRCGQTHVPPPPGGPAVIAAVYAAPAAPKPHVLAVIAGVAGIAVAILYTIQGLQILGDLERVARAAGVRDTSAMNNVIIAGLVITAVTIYLGWRTLRGKLVSMLLLAVVNACFAFATSAMLERPRGGDPVGRVLVEAFQTRLSTLEPLGKVAIVVSLLAIAAFIATVARGNRPAGGR